MNDTAIPLPDVTTLVTTMGTLPHTGEPQASPAMVDLALFLLSASDTDRPLASAQAVAKLANTALVSNDVVTTEPSEKGTRRHHFLRTQTGTFSLVGGRVVLSRGAAEAAQPALAEPEIFLDRVYELHTQGKTRFALHEIFLWIDKALKANGVERCSELLEKVDVQRLDEDVMVGFLAATFVARAAIASRDSFVDRVRARLTSEIGSKKAEALLRELT